MQMPLNSKKQFSFLSLDEEVNWIENLLTNHRNVIGVVVLAADDDNEELQEQKRQFYLIMCFQNPWL